MHPNNPYAPLVDHYKAWKDFYFTFRWLNEFAQATDLYLKAKRKALIWEETNILSRPINWNGGH